MGRGGQKGVRYCIWKRKKALNGQFCLLVQLAADIKDWKPLPPTRSFFSFVIIFHSSVGWHGYTSYSNSQNILSSKWKPFCQQALMRHRDIRGIPLKLSISAIKPGCREQWVRNWHKKPMCSLIVIYYTCIKKSIFCLLRVAQSNMWLIRLTKKWLWLSYWNSV